MAALTFKKSKNKISISYQKKPFDQKKTKVVFSMDELEELVTGFMAYFNEGKTELSGKIKLKHLCKKMSDFLSGNAPLGFSEKWVQFWHYRKEIYKYIKKHKLFYIEEEAPVLSKNKERKEIRTFRKENYNICQSILGQYAGLIDIAINFKNNFTFEKIEGFCQNFSGACTYTRENLCQNRQQTVEEKYQLLENDAMCIICPLNYYCKKTNWLELLYSLWLLLKNIKNQDQLTDELKDDVELIINKLADNKRQLLTIKKGWGI